MPHLQQILFVALLAVAIWMFVRKAREIVANIRLGRPEDYTDNKPLRWKNMLLIALGQQKMFRKPFVAILHLVIYAGFIIVNIEVLEIILDGILGTHRLFALYLGSFYSIMIGVFEVFAVGVIGVCIVFLARRNMIKVPRLRGRELNGWPMNDANVILMAEIVLMCLLLTMNASDSLLQQRAVPGYASNGQQSYLVSQLIRPLMAGMIDRQLVITERIAWWLHIAGILAFLNYLPYSKHLHIILGFPNAYYARLRPKGEIRNMPAIQNEVLYAMQPEAAPQEAGVTGKFGARDVMDLSWRNLLDAYSCTECGRCSAACPATITGKALSPRKIMMDTRDRMQDVRDVIRKTGTWNDDGKTLVHDYISTEELWACTTCTACVQECPVAISPLEIILELRRGLIMEEGKAPAEWNAMNGNIEYNFAPWKFNPEDREAWMQYK